MSECSEKQKCRILEWLQNWWPALCQITGIAVPAICGIVEKGAVNWYGASVLVGVALTIIAVWGNRQNAIRRRDFEKMQREYSRMEEYINGYGNRYYEMVSGCLSQVFKELKAGNADRISVYRYDEKERHFVLLGRHADNRTFCDRGRDCYPADQGCIGAVWRSTEKDDFWEIRSLPDPETNREEWQESLLQEYRVPYEVSRNFRMKSRSFYGVPVRDSHRIKIAIVIVESTKGEDSICGNEKMRKSLERNVGILATILESHAKYDSSPDHGKIERMGY